MVFGQCRHASQRPPLRPRDKRVQLPHHGMMGTYASARAAGATRTLRSYLEQEWSLSRSLPAVRDLNSDAGITVLAQTTRLCLVSGEPTRRCFRHHDTQPSPRRYSFSIPLMQIRLLLRQLASLANDAFVIDLDHPPTQNQVPDSKARTVRRAPAGVRDPSRPPELGRCRHRVWSWWSRLMARQPEGAKRLEKRIESDPA